jgi:hypothetical protein
MTTGLFHLQITGVVTPEEQRDAAISAFAKLLELSLEEAQQLFEQAPVTIKEYIDHDGAMSIESVLVRYGVETQRLPARDAPPSTKPDSIGGKPTGTSVFDNIDLNSVSVSEDWTPESSGTSEHEPVEDVHRSTHKADNLSAFHVDELSIQEDAPEFHKADNAEPAPPAYTGPERRKDQRRKHDRRDMIRFDNKPKKNDRRKGDRRRSESMWDKDHHDF